MTRGTWKMQQRLRIRTFETTPKTSCPLATLIVQAVNVQAVSLFEWRRRVLHVSRSQSPINKIRQPEFALYLRHALGMTQESRDPLRLNWHNSCKKTKQRNRQILSEEKD